MADFDTISIVLFGIGVLGLIVTIFLAVSHATRPDRRYAARRRRERRRQERRDAPREGVDRRKGERRQRQRRKDDRRTR